MQAISAIPATPYAPPSYPGTYSPGSQTSNRPPNGSGPQVTSNDGPVGFRQRTAGTPTMVGGGNARSSSAVAPIYNRPVYVPLGAPYSPLVPRGEDSVDRSDLLNYRVPNSKLSGFNLDPNGIYVPSHAGKGKTYFTKIDGNTYKVGGFDRSNRSWRVLDPKTDRPAFNLESEGGKWTPTSKIYPPGLKGRMLRALDGGINNVRQAKAQLSNRWTSTTSHAMRKLFNKSSFTQQDKARIAAGFDRTLKTMEKNRREGAWNLSVSNNLGPFGPSAVAYPNGNIQFSQHALRNWRNTDLNELSVHEHTHTGAGTTDHWYLNSNLGRQPNWGGNLSPFTFNNALNNADTMARATSYLAIN